MGTLADHVQRLSEALAVAAGTPLGRKALAGHDEDFQIELDGEPPMHVAIAAGGLDVRPGPVPEPQPLRFTRVEMAPRTLDDILEGRITPVEAMFQGRLFLRTRLYGGGLITMLLAAACQEARSAWMGRLSGEETGRGG